VGLATLESGFFAMPGFSGLEGTPGDLATEGLEARIESPGFLRIGPEEGLSTETGAGFAALGSFVGTEGLEGTEGFSD
jgi:hypothetical protein